MTERTDVVVVGGGIAGLSAARQLAAAGFDVVLIEATARLGGKIASASLGGLRIDVGAESVLVRRPEAPALISSLGLQDRLVHPTSAAAQILVDGHVVPVPPSAMGVPGDIEALAGLLTPAGLDRARRERSLPAPPLTADVAIGALVDERFGPEVTDRLLEPLLGGVYAGHSRRLSFEAVNGSLFAAARVGGPLSSRAAATRRPGDGPVFGGLAGGITTLVEFLDHDLERRGVRVHRKAVVQELRATADGYEVLLGDPRDPGRIHARAAVLATPGAPTARLLGEGLGIVTADRLAAIPYASMAVVALAVRGVEPIGSGLLAPPGQLPTIKAVTHSSNKWAWVAHAAEQQLGSGTHVIRASVGRLGEERLLQIGDGDLVDRTVAELRTLPGWERLAVMSSTVQRWGGGLPQYEVGHRDLVAELRIELDDHRGLAVCGAAYDGVGIAACLGSAAAAVTKITADLGAEVMTKTVGRQA